MSYKWNQQIDIPWWSSKDYIQFPSGKKQRSDHKKNNIKIIISLFVVVLILIFVYLGKISIKSVSQTDSKIDIKIWTPVYDVWTWWISQIQPVTGTLLYSPKHSWDKRQETIKRSSDYLYVWMYNITHIDAVNVIRWLARDGTQVKLILEDNKYLQWEDNGNSINLSWRGIQVKNDSDLWTNYVHAKWFISNSFAIIQTANLTYGWFESSREYYFISEDKQIISNLKFIFDHDRAWVKIDPKQIHPNILVCPMDCRSKIQTLLYSANKSILIQNQYIQDEQLETILNLKEDQWVDIKITLPKNDDNLNYQNHFGTEVRVVSSPYIHAKIILIDDKYLLISSINMSSNSMDNNRELWIITTDNQAIGDFKKVFYADWNKWK